MNAVPYGEVDLLRIWAALIGKVSGGLPYDRRFSGFVGSAPTRVSDDPQ